MRAFPIRTGCISAEITAYEARMIERALFFYEKSIPSTVTDYRKDIALLREGMLQSIATLEETPEELLDMG